MTAVILKVLFWRSGEAVDNDLNYDDVINGKNVLIFDDTVTTGKTISDSGEAICSMFIPKSITFITLFSALNDNENSQQKTNVVN